MGNIGARNAEASRQKLKELGIPLLAEDTGLKMCIRDSSRDGDSIK